MANMMALDKTLCSGLKVYRIFGSVIAEKNDRVEE